MKLVIADTSPINYLLLIGHIEILPSLFERVIVPGAVANELRHPKAPPAVRKWIVDPPAKADFRQTTNEHFRDPALDGLDAGEADAIALAMELGADLLLMDDGDGVAVARAKGSK